MFIFGIKMLPGMQIPMFEIENEMKKNIKGQRSNDQGSSLKLFRVLIIEGVSQVTPSTYFIAQVEYFFFLKF